MKVTLSLTHRCNLACSYCYAGQSHAPDMSAATGRKVIDFVLALCPPGHPLRIHFFGGEPLLCLHLMQEIASYLRQKAGQAGVPYTLGVTSNGTILGDKSLRFLREEGIALCVSIDGSALVHDRNRRFKSGRGSYSIVMSNLHRALEILGYVQVNAVYGPDTVAALPDSVRSLVDEGVRIIHLNPNITAAWMAETVSLLREAFAGVGQIYIDCYERGQEVAIAALDSKIVLFLKGGYGVEDMCCMSSGELAFAPSGNIYPCERFIGDDQGSTFRIGSVDTGFDIVRRGHVMSHRGNRTDECGKCGLRPYCMNWCGCTNCAMTGHTDQVGPTMCAVERATIEAAQGVLSTLSERRNPLFIEHLLKYVHVDNQLIQMSAKGDSAP